MQLYVFRNNQQLGPFEENAVLDQLRSGRLSPDDLGIREGETDWSRLGDIFAGRMQFNEPAAGSAPPVQAAGQAAFASPSSAAPKAAGGCRRPLGWAILIIGLLVFLGGAAVAVATPYGYSTMTCDVADEKMAKIDELKKKYDEAKGTPAQPALEAELRRELESVSMWNESCGRERSTKRMFQIGSIAVAVVGFVMALIGFFVRRVRRA
jgi:hypothetical protein